MKLEQILQKLDSYKPGTFVHMEWEKDISSVKAKKLGIKIVKKSSGIVRTEINYENLKNVQGVERGDKESWFEHYTKGILQNKKDPEKKYLQAFPVPGKNINVNMVIEGNNTVCGGNVDQNFLYENGLINKSALTNVNELDTFIVDIDKIKIFN